MHGWQFLNTAQFLTDNLDTEDSFRSSISRAYYACYIEIRDMLKNICYKELRKFKISKKIGHTNLIKILKNCGYQQIEQIGQELSSLYSNRLNADYKMNERITKDDADCAIDEAKEILCSIKNINKKDLKKGITNYLKEIYKK